MKPFSYVSYAGELLQAKAFDLMRADQVRRTIVRTHN